MKNSSLSRLITTIVFSAALLSVSSARADLLAYYVDGSDQGGMGSSPAAFADVASNSAVSASSLNRVGVGSGTAFTVQSLNVNPIVPTPAGPTAGSPIGSDWTFAFAFDIDGQGGTYPVIQSTNDYYGFTVSALPGTSLDLDEVSFDRTIFLASAGDLQATYTVFASVDAGEFVNLGSQNDIVNVVNMFTAPTTQVTDLSSITGAQSVEIRIALTDNRTAGLKGMLMQAIQLRGTVSVPEPATCVMLLGGLVSLAAIRRR